MSQPIILSGIGGKLPGLRVTNEQATAGSTVSPDWICKAAGPHARHAATIETTLSMGADAARVALANAGSTGEDIDLIICAASAPSQAVPCTAALLQNELALPDGGSTCFDINATCLSFLAALQCASSLLLSRTHKTALIVSSEIVRQSLDPTDPRTNYLFGDAAAAVVVRLTRSGESSSLDNSRMTTYSSLSRLAEVTGGGTLHHPNDPETVPQMNMFQMDGKALYRAGKKLFGPFLDRFLEDTGWNRADINLVVPHQASRHALDLLTNELGFSPAQIVETLSFTGNAVAASIPYALAYASECDRLRRGDRVLLLGTGAGLSLGAVALTY